MKELGVRKQVGDSNIFVTIKELNVNKEIQCAPDCWQARGDGKGCDEIQKLQQSLSSAKSFFATEVVVEISQLPNTDVSWSIGREDIVLIDSEGFQNEGYILCYHLTHPRESKEHFTILPGTRAIYRQLFPVLPDGIQVSKLAIKSGRDHVFFSMSDVECQVPDVPQENQSMIQKSASDDFQFKNEVKRANRDLDYIRLKIYSRLNNCLEGKDAIKLENEIDNKIFEFELFTNRMFPENHSIFSDAIAKIKSEYHQQITLSRDDESITDKVNVSHTNIDDLLSLTPDKFEEYVCELFIALGYPEGSVTSYTHDRGIDIILKDNKGLTVGVQCKRFKGTVGAPDVQKFIGALAQANITKGIFVTTGSFSFEAERTAYSQEIELINKVKLCKLIDLAKRGNNISDFESQKDTLF